MQTQTKREKLTPAAIGYAQPTPTLHGIDTEDPKALEDVADKLLRDTRAHRGDYPAYSEVDLKRKAEQRGEVAISSLLAGPDSTDKQGADKSRYGLLKKGIRLFDSQSPVDARSRVKPGYDILLLLIVHASDLTPQERTAIDSTMAGLSPRDVEERDGVPMRTFSYDLSTAISVLRQRREELEQDFDLERTAKILHLQRTHLPPPGNRFRVLLIYGHSTYVEEVERVMLGATKPLLVPAERRCRYDRQILRRLALELPQSQCKRHISTRGRRRKTPASGSRPSPQS